MLNPRAPGLTSRLPGPLHGGGLLPP